MNDRNREEKQGKDLYANAGNQQRNVGMVQLHLQLLSVRDAVNFHAHILPVAVLSWDFL